MKITEELNETVIHFGRILTEKEKALMEICLVFFQSDIHSNSSISKEKITNGSHTLDTDGNREKTLSK